MSRPRSHWLMVPFLVLLAACGSGGGGSGGTGTMALALTDAPFPATEDCLSAALLVVDRVTARSESGWTDIPLVGAAEDGTLTLDVLDLRAGLTAGLGIGEVPAGSYDEIRLHIVESRFEFTDGSPSTAFKVPSGGASGLKIKIEPAVVVAEGQTTALTLDFDLSSSFHTTGEGNTPTCDDLKSGETKVIFHPVIRAVQDLRQATVAGTTRDGAGEPVADVEVTAFVAGTVVDGETHPDALTFSAATGLGEVAHGEYMLMLPPGTYDLYVRAQNVADRTLASAGVTLLAGDALTDHDLTVP